MTRVRVLRALALWFVAVGLVTVPARAEARKVVIINTGTDVFEVGPLPPALAEKAGENAQDWRSGYQCSVFGVFWAYLYWWDCKPVIYSGDNYDDSEEVATAVGAAYSKSDITMPFWPMNGRWIIGGGLLIIVLGVFILGRGGSDEDDDEDEDAPAHPARSAGTATGKAGGRGLRALVEKGQDRFSGKSFPGADLSGLELTQAEFKGAKLPGANFSKTKLIQVNFEGADLSGADFSGATVTQCEFERANLREARLDAASFSQCEFEGAALDGVSTNGTTFSQCEDLEGLAPEQTYESMWDMDSDEQLPYARGRLEALCPQLDGRVVAREDDDEVYLAAKPEGRSTRVVIDYSDGEVSLESKLSNRTGVLALRYEPGAEVKPDVEDDEWSDGTSEKRGFVAPDVYYEEYPDEFNAMTRLLQQLPEGLPVQLAEFMTNFRIDRLLIDAEVLKITFADELLKLDLGVLVSGALAYVEYLCQTFEAGQAEVSAKPHVYIGGQPVQGGNLGEALAAHGAAPVAAAATAPEPAAAEAPQAWPCPSCSSDVTPANQFCPACGLELQWG